ncbi:uncharacterized protein LOC144544464 [Carex rostrata]
MFIGSMSKNIKLEGPSGYTWHVKIMRSDNTFALQSGWKEFVTANKIDENDFIVFRYKDNSSFKVLIFDRSGCEKVAPFFAKNMNTESEKEIIYLSSTDTDESSCGILTRAARARMTRERVCGKRKQRDFVQESTESESSSGKDNRCGIVQRKCTAMIPRETLVSLMPAGETSRPQKQKRGRKRVNPESVYTRKRAEGLPDGWVINERVRLSGKQAGYKYKYFIEPGTGNSFRSRKSVWHHLGLGLPDSQPSKNKHRKPSARGDFVQESTESESSSGKDNRCGIAQRKCTSMISRETLVSRMPAGETSRPEKQKGGRQRVSLESVYTGKCPEGLPDGWVINERVRLSGKQAGYKDKYFIEPGTLKSFRSLKSVWHHLGLPDSKPCNNKHRKSPARGVAKSLRRKSS